MHVCLNNIGSGLFQCVSATDNATSSSGNASDMTWTGTFSYGTVSGRATCVTNGASAQGYVDRNNDLTKSTYTDNGANCWYQMTSPSKSAWVFMSGNTGDQTSSQEITACKNSCANECASAIRYIQIMREGFYDNPAGSNQ